LEIGARVQRGVLYEVRLDAARGRFDYGGVNGLVLDFGKGLFEERIEFWILWRHLISPI
jgi:hypothetical protein